jgi:hypothetical protein
MRSGEVSSSEQVPFPDPPVLNHVLDLFQDQFSACAELVSAYLSRKDGQKKKEEKIEI